MLFGLIIGVAIGFFFKPQIETAVVKVIRKIKEARERDGVHKDTDHY
jgi:hypothetical protein